MLQWMLVSPVPTTLGNHEILKTSSLLVPVHGHMAGVFRFASSPGGQCQVQQETTSLRATKQINETSKNATNPAWATFWPGLPRYTRIIS